VRREGAQIVVCGTMGDHRYYEAFRRLQQEYAGHFVFLAGEENDARRIYAGVDMLLVPSLYEPCGLQQLLAMRYGAVPVVRHSGGLADTVVRWNVNTSRGRGFIFRDFDQDAFWQAVSEAVQLYRSDPRRWREIQEHNMRVDSSWGPPAQQYLELYHQAQARAQQRSPLRPGVLVQPERNDWLAHAVLQTNELAAALERTEDYLRQVAHTAAALLNVAAVLIWIADEKLPQRLRLCAATISTGAEKTLFQWAPANRSWSWQYVYRREPAKTSLPAQLGFLDSAWARQEHWEAQLSVPINTRGVIWGRVDAFACDWQRDFTDWDINALSVLANVLAVNLDRQRREAWTATLLTVDREIISARTVAAAARVILRHARELTHAEVSWLSVPEEELYMLDEQDHFQVVTAQADSLAPGASIMRVPLRGDSTGNLGELGVARQSAWFTHEDEVTLAVLAQQVTCLWPALSR